MSSAQQVTGNSRLLRKVAHHLSNSGFLFLISKMGNMGEGNYVYIYVWDTAGEVVTRQI